MFSASNYSKEPFRCFNLVAIFFFSLSVYILFSEIRTRLTCIGRSVKKFRIIHRHPTERYFHRLFHIHKKRKFFLKRNSLNVFIARCHSFNAHSSVFPIQCCRFFFILSVSSLLSVFFNEFDIYRFYSDRYFFMKEFLFPSQRTVEIYEFVCAFFFIPFLFIKYAILDIQTRVYIQMTFHVSETVSQALNLF